MNWRLTFHLLAQIVAQGAVAGLFTGSFEKYFAAAVAIIGVVAAYYDTTSTNLTPPTV